VSLLAMTQKLQPEGDLHDHLGGLALLGPICQAGRLALELGEDEPVYIGKVRWA